MFKTIPRNIYIYISSLTKVKQKMYFRMVINKDLKRVEFVAISYKTLSN